MSIITKIVNFFKKKGLSYQDSNSVNENYSFYVSEKYRDFPMIEAKPFRTSEKTEAKYDRLTMDFKHVSKEVITDYLNKLEFEGYEKSTDVRFDYHNTYIILEIKDSFLHLVFHIKKQ